MIKIEACCGSIEDVMIAHKLGVDQIELNSSLENGGMTPSVGTLVKAKELTNIPIYTMVRARPKGFYYTEDEYQVMLKDAENLIEHGADGIVFGFLKQDGSVDIERTQEMINVIGDKDVIFHKAFDSTFDLEETIQKLIALKVTRILTGGGTGNIMDNLETLKMLQDRYGDEIELIVGGGVRESNAKQILEETGIKQIHFTGRSLVFDESTYHNSLIKDKDEHSYEGVNYDNMHAIINEVRKVGE